jgi:hypothetical protein
MELSGSTKTKKARGALTSEVLIKKIPRLLGPGLSKGKPPLPQSSDLGTDDYTSGKFPAPVFHSD